MSGNIARERNVLSSPRQDYSDSAETTSLRRFFQFVPYSAQYVHIKKMNSSNKGGN